MMEKIFSWLTSFLLITSIIGVSVSLTIYGASDAPHVIEIASLENGLVGYWTFNEGAGTTAGDTSGNGNHGTIYGASWVDGKSGKALSFNGTSDYVEVPYNSLLDFTELTLAAWVKADDLSITRGIIGKTYTFDSAGEWSAFLAVRPPPLAKWQSLANSGKSLLYGNTALSTETWYYIAGTYDGATMKIYVNGAEDGSASQSGPLSINMPLWIGRAGRAHFFSGIIDEVRVYNRVLSANEIQELASLVTTPTSLSISPSSFTLNSGESITLTATLTSAGFTLAGKAISWSAASGSFSADNGTTDSSGQVTVTYTAPTITTPTTVVITASFAGDNEYGPGIGTSNGTLAVPSSENISAATGGTISINIAELGVTVDVLVVLPNALSNDTTITVRQTPPENLADYVMLSQIFDIGPSGTNFAEPSTLTLPYNENGIPEGVGEENLAIYRRTGDNWERLGGTVDVSANTVSVQIDHLSEYAVMAQLPTQLSVVVTPVWVTVVAAIVLVAALSGIIWRYSVTSKKERSVKGQKRKQAARIKRKRRTR